MIFSSFFFFTAVYITDHSCTKNGNSSFFKPKIRGLYTRAVTDQERVIVACVRYIPYVQRTYVSIGSIVLYYIISDLHQYKIYFSMSDNTYVIVYII